jgi:hypothetical protein
LNPLRCVALLSFLQAPKCSGSLYYNYKGTHSIVLMAVVDAHYKFILIDVGAYGRNSDGGIFANSCFGKLLANGVLNIPQPSHLPTYQVDDAVPYVIVGDEGFP